jgi:hypothetical protein
MVEKNELFWMSKNAASQVKDYFLPFAALPSAVRLRRRESQKPGTAGSN